eukprot:Awhi_evm1s3453
MDLFIIGAEVISEALANHRKIERLDLTCNHIGNPGTSFISKALCLNRSLISLNISFNHIGYLDGNTCKTEVIGLAFAVIEIARIGLEGVTKGETRGLGAEEGS